LPVGAILAGVLCGVLYLAVSGTGAPPSPESDAWYVKGNQFEAEQRYDEALAAFEQARRLEPRKPDSYFRIGMIQLQQQDWRHAESSFSDFVKRSPLNARAWMLLGRCREKLGDLSGAREAYRRALTRNPFLGEPWAGLQRLELGRDE
jgi:tetratricopeptide (TPR) repeat protein